MITNYNEFKSIYENRSYDGFNTLNEAGLSRLVDKVKIKKEDFAILTGWRNSNSFKKNRQNNNDIIKYLNNEKMGPYLLIGHWKETISNNNIKDYNSTKDVKEDSIMVIRPKDITTENFIKIITEIGEIYDQDSVLISIDGNIYLYWDSDKIEKIGSVLSLNKISDVYSQMRNKKNVPFVFEGTIHPTNIMSMMLFKAIGLNWIKDIDFL